MLSTKFLTAAAIVASLTATTANASLIVNGSFEQSFDGVSNAYIYQDPRSFTSLGAQADHKKWGVYSVLPGWNMLYNNGIEINHSGLVSQGKTWNAQDGNHFLELDTHFDVRNKAISGPSNAGIFQNLNNLVRGQTYELTFWYRARNTNANDNLLDVYWLTQDELPLFAGRQTATIDYSSAVAVNGQTLDNNESWVQYTFNLVATSANMFLGFGGSGDATTSVTWENVTYTSAVGAGNRQGALLDNVSLAAKVSEPATFALFGLAAFGLLARRRKA